MSTCTKDGPQLTAAASAATPMFAPARAGSRRAKTLQLRDSVRHECALVHEQAMSDAGLTQDALAAKLGTQRQRVQEMTDPFSGTSPSVVQVAMGPHEWAAPLLRWAATKQRMIALLAPENRWGDDFAKLLADCMLEIGQAIAAMSGALADGALSDSELELCERECREAAEIMTCATAVFSAVRAKQREER